MPIPRAENFDELNAHLESECLERMDARLRGHTETHRRATILAGCVNRFCRFDSFSDC